MMRAFHSLLFLLLALPLLGADGTTPGTLTTKATFHSISVAGAFTGDDNQNNSAVVQYRTGGGTWRPVYAPWIDRRANIETSFATNANTVSNQARCKIVGLTANTSYDVKITWSDGDGITGDANITNTLSTTSYAMVTNATELYVDASAVSEGTGTSGDPFKTITNAIAQCVAGDTIRVKAGSYTFFTWSKSGNGDAWIVVRADTGASPVITGGTNQNCVLISANNVVLDGFTLASATNSSIKITAGQTNVWVLNCNLTNAVADQTSGAAGASGVLLGGQNTNVYILTNRFHTTRTTSTDTSIYGIFLGANLDKVCIQDNYITNFWDGIGTGNNFTHGPNNSDIARNTFINFFDDPVELEGDYNNVAFWGNTTKATNSYTILAVAGVIVGPTYIFRNVCYGTNLNTSAIGVKNDHSRGSGRTLFFHNVFDTRAFGTSAHEAISSGSNSVFYNNIISANGNCLYNLRSTCTLDYNLYTNATDMVGNWNGATTYANLAAFQAATSQEANGKFDVPQFNSDYTLAANSPALNSGIVISNFNDGASFWPFVNAAPDIGAFEEAGAPVANNANTDKLNVGVCIRR